MTGGQILPPRAMDDDTIGPVVVFEGYVELTIDVVDRFTPQLAGMLRMIENMNAVRSSFARLGEAVSDLTVGWPTPLLDPRPGVDLLYPAVTPQPWARHSRETTSLELAIERWNRANPRPLPRGFSYHEWDETSARDTGHCAGTGGSWSDLMSRIDELTDDAS